MTFTSSPETQPTGSAAGILAGEGRTGSPAVFSNTAPASFREPTATAALMADHQKEQMASGDRGHIGIAVNGQQRGTYPPRHVTGALLKQMNLVFIRPAVVASMWRNIHPPIID